jgi:hypothetical protein
MGAEELLFPVAVSWLPSINITLLPTTSSASTLLAAAMEGSPF